MDQPAGASADLETGIPLADIRSDGMVLGHLADREILIVSHGGEYHALSATCTHMGAPLRQGLLVDGRLHCPWHHARFCLRSGEAVAAPAFEPLRRYEVQIREGRLYVGKALPRPPIRPSQTPAPRVVIVGGGAGGHACADMLVRLGVGGAVTIVSDDADPPYDRTLCSKQYLIGMVERDECRLPAPGRYVGAAEPAEGAAIVQQHAASIDLRGRHLILGSGARLAFDVLVLALGAEPERPSTPGFDSPRVHVLRTLQDADAILAQARQAKTAAVVGASFIALEAAASLTQRHLEVHVIAPDEVPLSKLLGTEVGSMIRKVHEEKKVRLHLGRKVERYEGTTLTLDDGSSVEADLVVLGAGVRPRTQLAQNAGIAVAPASEGGGVIVDRRLETSARGVFAVGDIARYPDRTSGETIRVEHWVHAQRQGQFVARAIVDRAQVYEDVPFFWSAHFDTGLRYSGHVRQINEATLNGSVDERSFTVRYADGGRGRAFATCNRDMSSLQTEADWERELKAREDHDPKGTPGDRNGK